MDSEPPSLLLQATFDSTFWIGFIIILILLLCSAFISGTEVALFSLNNSDLESAKEENLSRGKVLEQLLRNPKKLLASILIANNFVNVGIVLVFALIKEPLFANITLDWLQWTLEVIVVTFLILMFGEILPKIYASRNKLYFAQKMTYPTHYLNQFFSVLSAPMTRISEWIEHKLGNQKTSISIDQLSQALELTSTENTTKEEQKILEGIVSFGNTEASQVMSPRIDVFGIEINQSFKEVMTSIVAKGYSRIPVYEESLDHIVGVLYIKDLIPHLHQNNFAWNTLIREPFFIPENKKLDDLLKEFKSMKNHLAIVVDEFGGTSGLVTLEDIIEEIVGDISDEFDDENLNYSQIDERNFLFEGKINLKDFFRITGLEEDDFETHKGDAETLAGFILEIFAALPKKGQKITFKQHVFSIEAVDNKRIKQIKVTLAEASQ